MTDTTSPDLTSPSSFGPFDEALYWMSATREEFDVPRLAAEFASSSFEEDKVVLCAPRDGEAGSYWATLHWSVTDERTYLNIEYRWGPLPHAHDEREPFAEGLMAWLGQFFSAPTFPCHAHLRCQFPGSSRETTFPLELTSPAPSDVELYGVALRMKRPVNGVRVVRLSRSSESWYAEAIAEREVQFGSFSPIDDATAATTVLDRFLRRI